LVSKVVEEAFAAQRKAEADLEAAEAKAEEVLVNPKP
jgi:hypothetical protein